MSRNSNVMADVTWLEDRLTALLTRIDAAAGVFSEQAVRELSPPGEFRSATASSQSSGASLEQLRQLTQLWEHQQAAVREERELPPAWVNAVQEQLSRIEQQVEELRTPAAGQATFA